MKVDRRTALKTGILSGFALLTSKKSLADCVTTDDIEGPYYIAGSPETSKLASAGAKGARLFITGTVYANDCKTPIANAVVDVWHANDAGAYEDEDYRGIVKTDSSGKYAFETILPGKYLNGSQYRPRHLHYKVSAPDFDKTLVLTTQIYFEGDTSIPADPWASADKAEERIIPITTDNQDAEHGVVDVVLDIDPGVVSVGNGLVDLKTGLRSIYPNPVHDSAQVQWTMQREGTVDIKVFDVNGRETLSLISGMAYARGEHTQVLSPNNNRGIRMSPGIYIMKLWVSGTAVDVKRFMVS